MTVKGAHQRPENKAENGDGHSAPDVRAPAGVALGSALLALVKELVDGEADGCAHR